ncbi:heme-binding protein [Oceanisphaera pacifica]|uniref:Heme-binding protein n=1 Tax=Oceanisphaera pacifica TaxID=2818389 RepID=A0ABS3NHY5_9GAMM|nr:heme-binding protein [Oceanisphaera pacifica]
MSLSTRSIIKACKITVEEIIKEDGQAVCLAVVDSSGALFYFYRMDNAAERLINIAIGKAYTSARMGVTTAIFRVRLINENLSTFDFMDSNFTSLPRGIPLFNEKNLIGGVGVSGRDFEGDILLCKQFSERIQSVL